MAVGRATATRAVGRYQLVHELGQSYLGPLWAVRVEGADSSAQLAMLRLVSLARLDADTRVRLLEAAWQAMEVRDDRVCSVTDVVASDGELGVVSDYVEGVTLRGLSSFASVRRKPAPPPVVLRIALDLLAAVAALHRTTAELGDEAVPLYGGLSADSVLLTSDGRTLVLDVAVTSAASTIETLGGNPERAAYAAPEQLRSPPSADARTDVFAVGVLVWELLACRRLFVGSDKAVAQKVLSSKIPRPDELRRKGDPELPGPLVLAVMQALERDPAARPASADALAELLAGADLAPADHAEVATYVTTLAEGALQRARDALRTPSSGVRAAVQRAAKPAIAAPLAASPAPPAAPAAPATKPLLPARVEAKPALPLRAEARPTAPARADAKPPMPARPDAKATHAEQKPAPAAPRDPKRPAPESEPKRQIRARQPTMMGIQAVTFVQPPASGTDTSSASGPSPEKATDAITDHVDEEPTAQFASRDLLRQVEAMARKSEPVKAPPSEAPVSLEATSSDFPEPTTKPNLADDRASVAPVDGGWLDDPASLPPPAMVDREAVTPDAPAETIPKAAPLPHIAAPYREVAHQEAAPQRPVVAPREHAREREVPQRPVAHPEAAPQRDAAAARFPDVMPSSEAQTARTPERPQTSKFPGPLSIPPSSMSQAPAYLPSQMPPPLLHDPRARSTQTRAAPGVPSPTGMATGLSQSTRIGIVLSIGLAIVSAAVSVVVLRHQHENEPEPVPTTTVVRSEGQPAPPLPVAAPPVPTVAAAAPLPSAVPEPAPTAPEAAPATPTTPSVPAAVVTTTPAPALAPRAVGAVATPPRAATPAPKRAPPKKKARYVPDDI